MAHVAADGENCDHWQDGCKDVGKFNSSFYLSFTSNDKCIDDTKLNNFVVHGFNIVTDVENRKWDRDVALISKNARDGVSANQVLTKCKSSDDNYKDRTIGNFRDDVAALQKAQSIPDAAINAIFRILHNYIPTDVVAWPVEETNDGKFIRANLEKYVTVKKKPSDGHRKAVSKISMGSN